MNLELDDIQHQLVAVTTEVCDTFAGKWHTSNADQGGSVKALADIGILGVRHPEPQGSGLSAVEAVLSAFVCGAALAPTPLLVWADLLGSVTPGLLSGSTTITGSFDQDRGISYGGRTDQVVFVSSSGAYVLDSEAVTWASVPHIDPTLPRAVVRGAIPTTGVAVAGADEIECWRWQFAVLVAAHLVGVGVGALDAAVDYAKKRQQFGRPIGSFQAIKHMLADTYTNLEMSRSQVLTAALCWSERNPAAPDQAIAAAVVAARGAIQAAQTAIQVHGGMGFTTEAVPHLYYKRALQLQDDLLGAGAHAAQLLHRDLTVHG
ncbi:acyl-CoA dehydrogenase family protein [Mycobacterium sp. Aquia_216]|uniref:acyl-CoA dehydrogenase family protein n=1 Tax=Mycobacterium sp. Aquia_216 TaxID=2991729 RepID=UPI00227C1531|nr:acyl-CoA dehydrogenase family protein [Mycobacterium sp. Aquia_216]WAJ45343.1 acyl-CoA dehydrogenase family protein [Mycobacterium sp. Aquia_216]